MNNWNKRLFASFLFIIVFSAKMIISVAPIFSMLDAKVAASVILQLEQETKDDNDNADKDAFKEKKDFDELIFSLFDYKPLIVKTTRLHKHQKEIIVKVYHQSVPTPPPNV